MTTFTTQDRQDAQRTPLTEEYLYAMAKACGFNVDGKAINDGIETAADFHGELFEFARAIERAHGIGE